MLIRSLFTFAALALFAVSAAAQDIPAKLAPPRGAPAGRQVRREGRSDIRLQRQRVRKRMGFQGPSGRAYRRAGQTVRQALCRSDLGSSRWLEDRRQGFSKRARSEGGRDSLAAIVDRIVGIGVLAGTRFVQRVNTSGGVGLTGGCPTAGTERRVDYTADYIFYK